MHGTHPRQAMIRLALLLACLSAAASASAALAADNWPEYRGPTADGHTDEAKIPLSWSETEHVKWKTAIPGLGWSTPVIWADQIWMTTSNESGTERFAICVDKNSGKITQNIKLFDVANPEPLAQINSHASPSPVIEEGRVYVHFGTQGTACIDTKTGEVLWKRCDLKLEHQVGAGSTPILFNDTLIVHCDGTDVQYIIALNKRTGETVWKTPRSLDLKKFNPNVRKSFDTPVIATVKDHLELISVGGQCVYGYDPATGRELWRFGYKGYSNAFRPAVVGDIAIFSTCYDVAHLEAIRLGGTGDVTATNRLWTNMKNAPYKTSPVVVNGLFYMISDAGIATCLDPRTGTEVWKERVGGEFSASPLCTKGRIYLFDQSGKSTVLAPGRSFSVIATSKLDAGFMASAAVTGKALILRTKTHLYRIEN